MQIKIIFQRYVITEVITFDTIESHFKHMYVKYIIKINTITLHHMVLTLHATYICKQESMMKNAHLANSRCDLAPPPPFFSTRGPRVRPRGHVLLPCVGGMQ